MRDIETYSNSHSPQVVEQEGEEEERRREKEEVGGEGEGEVLGEGEAAGGRRAVVVVEAVEVGVRE